MEQQAPPNPPRAWVLAGEFGSSTTVRLAVSLTPEQRSYIDAEAARRGVSAATIVRDLIDTARRRPT